MIHTQKKALWFTYNRNWFWYGRITNLSRHSEQYFSINCAPSALRRYML